MKELYDPGNLYGWKQELEGTKYQDKRNRCGKTTAALFIALFFRGIMLR